MKKFLLSFMLLAISGIVASAAPAELFTVTFGSAGNVSAPNNSSYTATQTYTGNADTPVSGKSWTVVNFNNNNNGWSDMIKCGRKNNASTGSVATSFAFTENITNVTASVKINSAYVTSANLYVSADGTNWGNAVASITSITTSTTSISFEVPTPTSNQYYKVDFVCSSAKGNGVVSLYSITYTGEASNPDDTRDEAGLKYETTSYTIPFGDEFPTPELINPNNLDVTYSSSNEAVATVAADGAVTVVGAGETTIKAEFAGNDTYKDDIATYTLTVLESATTLAEFIEKGAANTSLSLIMNCELTVTYAHGSNVYVTDGTSYALIYKANLGLNTGDVVAKGWEGKVTIYSGLPEIVPADATLATTGTTAEVNYATVEAIGIENLTQVVLLKNVTFAAATEQATNKNFNGIAGENTYAFRNTFGVASVAAGNYDVLCVVSAFKQGATTIVTDPANLQLLPIEYTEVAAPSIVGSKISISNLMIAEDGMLEAKYSFSIENYTGGEVSVTAQVLDADNNVVVAAEDVIVEPSAPAAAAMRAAATTKAFEGDILAEIPNVNPNTEYRLAVTAKYGDLELTTPSDPTTTGVEGIVVDTDAAAEYYNLQGVRVANPAGGVYIRVSGGKATKVYVR